MVPRGDEQFVKRSPIVSPVEFEADALPQFRLVNFTAEPFVENVLVAGEDGFDSEHYRAMMAAELAKQRGQVALRIGQGMVVAHQNDSGFGDFVADVAGGNDLFVRAVGFAKVAQILTPRRGVNGANLALDAGNGVELGGTAPRS